MQQSFFLAAEQKKHKSSQFLNEKLKNLNDKKVEQLSFRNLADTHLSTASKYILDLYQPISNAKLD